MEGNGLRNSSAYVQARFAGWSWIEMLVIAREFDPLQIDWDWDWLMHLQGRNAH